ncbi:phthiocerol synthesis polyketide synthase type I PpsA [Phytohabitans houttuyneae]|uniref:Phthiocerol synthesis polyketide synthase type I PpsA n=1 Tax=Phytohabitans houttuyneae TaxID=1076126 RepID=A0A6V8KFE9_9ACTN|nr:phthiocerol synthesis polyketide synthase type I PpsA [Phytohabitans houttuyneae]
MVGLGCRFAGGADSPERFWQLLARGGDGIGELPGERWAPYAELGADVAATLRRATRFGGFLPDIEGFDAEFFGLSPREAALMDPQQRLLLEVAWEALEHAGIPPHTLAGGDTGVFVGVGSDDYGRRLLEDLPGIEAWTGIGAAMCAVANRVSYALDLRGPSMAVDTACSASLVAVHLACQSLRAGEGPLALAAGVNLIVSPGLTLTLDAAGAMAPDGRCKSFDASADGYGRGEGCGVLVLKLLADARRDGDRVLAVIRGSAVNQDGRTNGIMAPSGPAQAHVIGRAVRQAGVDAASVGYVEAHGTGTRLGDPLEAGALSAVYGTGRLPDEPCLIGSVKSNIGHLEAAAGVASLIKVVLALRHERIPPSLNHTTGNPAIDWANNGLRVVTEPTAWPAGDAPRRAGVSGFGYGGTIAHVVLEEAPAEPAPARVPAAPAARLYPLTAHSEPALRESAGALAAWLDGPGADTPLASVGHTLTARRTHLGHRAAVVAADRRELAARLRTVAAGDSERGTATGATVEPGAGLVWVFSGHGSQWAGMGRRLLAEQPAFAAVVDQLEPIFLEEIGFSPRQVLTDGDLATVDRVQTMIFVMQLGLAELWRAAGVRPDAVIGHSVGEIAAAVVAGALSLEDGARLICRRSALLTQVAGKGAMAMVGLPFEDVAAVLAGRTDAVPAIWSSPLSTVVAGDPAAIDELVERWKADGVSVRRVASDVAFHSPHMDALLSDLAEAAEDLEPVAPGIPVYSTAMSDPRSTRPLDGGYWAANLRNPVRLAAAVRAAAEDGYTAFLEISAHPVVTHSIAETLPDAVVTGTLRRDTDESQSLLTNAGELFCHGYPVDWGALQPTGELADLPTVAWQRRPHWRAAMPGGSGDGLAHDVDSHTLLGAAVPVAGQSLRLWRTLLDASRRPYPGSHTINGVEILPAAVLITTFLRAGASESLTDLVLRLPLPVDQEREVQVIEDGGGVRLASRAADDEDGSWLTHAAALTGPVPLPAALGAPLPGSQEADPDEILRHLAGVGVPSMAFTWQVESLTRAPTGLRAAVRAPHAENAAASAPPTWGPLLDAALSIAPSAYPGEPALRMVAAVGRLRVSGEPPERALVQVVLDPDGGDAVRVLIANPDGRVRAALDGLTYAELGHGAVATGPHQLVHEVTWVPLELPEPAPDASARPLLLLGPDGPLLAGLRDGLAATRLTDPSELAALTGPADVLVVPPDTAEEAAWLLTSAVQRLAAGSPDGTRLWAVTAGADVRNADHATLWGLGRVVGGEHPRLWGGVLDLDPAQLVSTVDTLRRVLDAAPPDDVVRLRDGAAAVARLARIAREPVTGPLRCHPDGTYLITGGLGVLGREVARWLVERGARRIVLAGRSPVPPRAEWDPELHALEALGVAVRLISLDITDAARAAQALTPEALGMPPIRGVVHAAGVLDNRLISNVDESSMRTVLRPKVDGARVLDRLFPPGSLDFLVLFSSCGQLLGLPGQASYGAANAYLDAFAARRRDDGCPGTFSFGWTSWRGQGMAVNAVVDAELRARGVGDIAAAEAFAAWDLAARHGGGHYPVLRTLPPEPGVQRLPLLDALPVERDEQPDGGGGAAEFAGLPEEQLRDRVRDEVGGQIAGEMRLPAQSLDPRRSLVEQGLDSVMTLLIRRRLERRFGHPLPATLLWHQPTVVAITEHLVELLSGAADDAAPAEVEERPVVGV